MGSSLGAAKIVRGVCPHDCPDTCALLVKVEDGVAIEVKGDPDHPATGGVLCTKVSRYTERPITLTVCCIHKNVSAKGRRQI